MLQFNTTFYTITSRCTSRLLWRIDLSFSTNSTITATKPVKSNHQKEVTALNIPTNQVKKAIATWKNVNDKLTSNSKAESSVSDAAKVKNSEVDTSIDLKPYRDLSTSGIIKEIKHLTATKNRNTYLLNYFFQNILEHNRVLKLGHCSCLLYSMSTLNYSDERLLQKICHDLINIDNIHIIMLTSLLRSVASIRYKNTMFLKHVCDNIIKLDPAKVKNNKDIVSLLLSLATLGYHSEAVDKIIELYKEKLTMARLGKPYWLKLVWSLTIFRKAEISDVASVLNKQFASNLATYDDKITLSHHLKLLNINGYAQYALKNYQGPLLDHSIVPCITSNRSKQKELNVILLQDTLKNMLPSLSHFKMNVNTNMGFLLDAEFFVDSDLRVVNVDTDKNEKLTKIGIMLIDYYATCLGEQDFLGLNKLYNFLLTCNDYKVICVPYQHFGVEDKVEKHVTYLRRKLWKAFNETI
ncbi:FAST kinase domain-containing protein 4 [Anthophora retusa]